MVALGWTAFDLYVAAQQYGSVELADVQRHVRSYDHLAGARRAYLECALHDELLERGLASPFRDLSPLSGWYADPARDITQRPP